MTTIGMLIVIIVPRIDLSLGGLTRVYLYLASLAGVIVFTIGLAGVLSYVLAAAFGLDVVYGGPRPQIQPAIQESHSGFERAQFLGQHQSQLQMGTCPVRGTHLVI